jgi:acyl transferase domain-containing protein
VLADGYARGVATNAIRIKRLGDAIRHNDPIRAMIRSTAVNSDGNTPEISEPSAESHDTMIRKPYERLMPKLYLLCLLTGQDQMVH